MKINFCIAMMCAAMAYSDTVNVPDVGDVTVPSRQQLHTLDLGIISIVHFGLNTFVDKEWGFGDTSPSVFNPVKFDAKQWVAAAKAGGIKRIVLVCKHHDGFCLWPSKLNKDYTVANSPWKDGKGDVVAEVRKATLEAGLEFAAYLSPWDRHQAEYAHPAYVEYFHSQWSDLLDNYGPISEIWLDGANGGDGWYGGNPGKRTLPAPANEYYDFNRLLTNLFTKNPDSVAFGPDTNRSMNWPGNETGFVPEGYPFVRGGFFRPPECDTPLRKGWFWHKDQQAKPLEELVTRYFESVGRGGILDFGLAPNSDGLLDDGDVQRLKEFGAYVNAFNAKDFAEGVTLVQKQTDAGTEYSLALKAPATFNAIDFQEDITKGMRIKAWRFEADGKVVLEGKLGGFRRMERFAAVTASNVKLVITECNGAPAVLNLRLRFAPDVAQFQESQKPARLALRDSWYARSLISLGNKDALERFREKLRSGKPVVYGAIGGSITAGAKADTPEQRYPNRIAAHLGSNVKLVNAGIGATGSLFGCYRAKNDLLKYNPDFITLEYAVNDQNSPSIQAGYEGLVRQCLQLPSRPLVLLIFTLNQSGGNAQEQQIPVGLHYQLPMLSYRDIVWPEITAGNLTWRDTSPDEVHPNNEGHALIAEMVSRFLDTAEPELKEAPLPQPLVPDALRYATGRLLDARSLEVVQNDGWGTGPHLGGYTGFITDKPGAVLKLSVQASEITLGYKRYAGPFGKAEISVDDQAPITLEGYFPIPNEQAWRGGHTVLQPLGKNLPAGKHTVTIKVLEDKHPSSTGHTFDIGYLLLAD